MRCKICGAKLKKDGDICNKCYNEFKDYEDLKANNEDEIFSVKRKYSPKYNLLKNGEIILLLLIISLAGIANYGTVLGILITILCIIFFGALMFFNKKRASRD